MSHRLLMISISALVAATVCAGCAAPPSATTSAASPGSVASARSPDLATSAPARSMPPTGPAATAATATPPPRGDQASATVDGVTITCPAVDATSSGGDAPFPHDITIAAVVRCETVSRSYPELGQWSVQLAEVADKQDFGPLVAQLRKPSAPLTTEPCPAIGQVLPWLAIIDASGDMIRPALPTDECGLADAKAIAAARALDYRAVDAVRVAQMRSPESLSTGCGQNWKDMAAFVAQPGRLPDTAGRLDSVGDLASSPSSVLVCLYRAGSSDHGLRVGTLVKGVTVTGEGAGELASEAGIVSTLPTGCSDAGTFATLSYGQGFVDYVELGGCHRLYTNDGRLGAASDTLVAAVRAALR